MRGFKDILPPCSYKFNFVKKIFESISAQFDVDLIELPLVEDSQLYFRTSGEESDVCNKELFEVRKYKGNFEDWVLRPEGTASCVRALIESKYLYDRKICRLGYFGPMFRYNRPQKGRYRQFFQAGFEWLGIKNKFLDLEIILSACDILNALNVKYSLEINSIGSSQDRAEYRKILKKHFTIETDPLKVLDKLDVFQDVPQMQVNEEDFATFDFLLNALLNKNIHVIHNPYLVRGLDYYNGIVFEFKIEGLTVLAGGRYDGLMSQLGGDSTPAIGFALGVDRIVDLLSYDIDVSKKIALISLNEDEYAFCVAQKLRSLGFNVSIFWGLDLKKGLKLASKSSKYAVIIGENEKNEDCFLMKNLQLSSQKKISLNCSLDDLNF